MKQGPAIVIIAALLWCRGEKAPAASPTPVDIDIQLVGYLDLPSEGVATAVFDTRMRPVLSIGSGTPRQARWRAQHTTDLPILRQELRGGRLVVWLGGQPPPGAGVLEVEVEGAVWQQPAVWQPAPDEHPDLQSVTQAASSDEALRRLDTLSPRLDESGRGAAARLRSTLLARAGDLRGASIASEEVARLFQNHPRRASLALRTAAFFHLTHHRVVEASETVARSRKLVEHLDDIKAQVQHTDLEARIAEITGRLGRAEALASQVVEGAWTIGNDPLYDAAVDLRASLLTDMGRPVDALRFLQGLADPGAPQALWSRQLNTAWVQLVAARACAPDFQPLDLAGQFVGLGDSPPAGIRADLHAEAWTNAAYAYFLADQPPEAADAVSRARALLPAGSRIPAFTDHLEAQIHLAAGRLAAARFQLEGLLDHLDGEAGADHRWRALHTLGAVARAEGHTEQALHLWLRAADELAAVGRLNWLRSGRATFLADRRELLIDLVTLLLDEGHPGLARVLLDQQSAPVLASLAREARLEALDETQLALWSTLIARLEEARRVAEEKTTACQEVPVDEVAACEVEAKRLSRAVEVPEQQLFDFMEEITDASDTSKQPHEQALPPDEAALLFVAADRSCTPARHRLLVTSTGLLRLPREGALLDVLRPHLVGLKHMHVIGAGAEGAELAARLMGTPGAPTVGTLPALSWLSRSARPASAQVVVVADPEDDLPHARESSEKISADTRLIGTEATRAAVLTAIQSAHLFHYEGHGDLAPGDPWNAQLRLADGPLTVSDILARRPRIGTVVLSGCKTGSTAHLSRYESLGLAEAFLLAGADRVIAPDRDVPDAEAAKFVERFYAHGGRDHPAPAFRATVLELGPAAQGWRFFGRP